MIRLRSLGALDLCRDDGSEVRPVLRQPKRLALLTYLAVTTSRGFQRRDTLVALFWPDLDGEHARGALRQAVRFLRRQLGEDALVSRGDEELALGATVWCDAVAFEEAVSQHQPEAALELYRGDFLAGFFVSEAAPELDQWIETQRARLRALAAQTAWLVAAKEELEGSPRGATHWARRALALSAHDEAALRQLVSLLDRLGDRAGAIQVYEDFAQGLAKEYDAEPSAETRALVEAVRARVNAPSAGSLVPPLPPGRGGQGVRPPPGRGGQGVRPPRRPVRIGAVLLAGVVAIGGAIAALTRARAEEPTVLAVGAIHDHTGSDSARPAGALADLLATNLARVPGVQVVSTARLYELLGQLGRFTDSGAAIARAARQAGATELVEGALYRAPDGTLRLDLRRVELSRNMLRGAYTARGAHPFALVDSATTELARALDIRAPTLRVTDVTTSSLIAHRFYEEGLRALSKDVRSAQSLFEAALVEDSTFAMAAYFVGICRLAVGDERAARAPLIRAARLAERATERERLLIRTTLAFEAHEPAGLAIAETLAARYPAEPDGQLLVGRGRAMGGDFLGALPHLRRVVEMDSLAFRGGAVRCRACEALSTIASVYWAADSFTAAERTAREGLRQTHGAPAWLYELAWIFERQGRRDEALATFQRVPPQTYADEGLTFRASLAIRTGDFAEADRMLNEILRVGAADLQSGALWFLSISLRYQGRVSEALAVARRLRRVSTWSEPVLIEAQALFEMGRPRAAAALFDSLGRLPTDPDFPGRGARQRTWLFTHLATSLAAAGDTAVLAGLADSLEAYGRRSAYGRDPRLHHHARGLLWRARGRAAEAEAAFRRAIYVRAGGYTRTHLELGRTLLELNRPQEAIAIVAPALRGPLDATCLYVTHTELHELLAQAYDAAGQPDSAAVHYRWVAHAWRNADPPFRPRVAQARRWLAAHGGVASR
jgi:DNA-binding SARP family transcriptional activator